MSRRFIAGAVCPRCGLMDKIVVDSHSDCRECVSCGYADARPPESGPQEVKTRVTRASARRVETAEEPVTLVVDDGPVSGPEPIPKPKPD